MKSLRDILKVLLLASGFGISIEMTDEVGKIRIMSVWLSKLADNTTEALTKAHLEAETMLGGDSKAENQIHRCDLLE